MHSSIVASEESINKLVEDTREKTPKVDICVNKKNIEFGKKPLCYVAKEYFPFQDFLSKKRKTKKNKIESVRNCGFVFGPGVANPRRNLRSRRSRERRRKRTEESACYDYLRLRYISRYVTYSLRTTNKYYDNNTIVSESNRIAPSGESEARLYGTKREDYDRKD